MRVTFLIDNAARDESLAHEWGLAVHIEYEGKNILLDTGGTGAFVKNAPSLGVELDKVDLGVLSHAHYDHSNGLAAFFELNDKAKFYLRKPTGENCYSRAVLFKHYVGIHKGWLETYKDRIVYVEGDFEASPGVWLIPHKTKGLDKLGKKARMYVKNGIRYRYDSFEHEQSLVFFTDKGLVIFNSCSHGGADNIINEVAATFPGQKLYALIGGFHLFGAPEADVRALAKRIADTGIERVFTGHCTGGHAFGILKETLGAKAERFYTGMDIEL